MPQSALSWSDNITAWKSWVQADYSGLTWYPWDIEQTWRFVLRNRYMDFTMSVLKNMGMPIRGNIAWMSLIILMFLRSVGTFVSRMFGHLLCQLQVIDGTVICVHGGLSPEIRTISQVFRSCHHTEHHRINNRYKHYNVSKKYLMKVLLQIWCGQILTRLMAGLVPSETYFRLDCIVTCGDKCSLPSLLVHVATWGRISIRRTCNKRISQFKW